MKILVGSKNPTKTEAVKRAFSKYFNDIEVIGIKIDSGVPEQPINDEIFEGAKNRALNSKKVNEQKDLGAEFFVGIEGGIMKLHSNWFSTSGICIINNKNRTGFGTSSCYELPKSITKRLLNGSELGDVMDEVAGIHNIKQKGGAIGFFTRDVLNRKSSYAHALISALIPFLNENLYFYTD